MPFQSRSTFSSCRDVYKYLNEVKAELERLSKEPGVKGKQAMHDFFME
jgi:hypothetical protein